MTKTSHVILAVALLLSGCATSTDERAAFYTSALTQEAWFAIQAEPAPDAWASFESALMLVPEQIRNEVMNTAIKEAKTRAAKN